MPVQKIGMVFTYTKPKLVPVVSSSAPALAPALATPTRSSSTVGMVQTVKRNTTVSIRSIMQNANHKCSSCGS
jgi:hypothetical protein